MAKKPKAKPKKYEDRIVLFIDFLGFKEHVDQTVTDPDYLTTLLAAMDRITEIADDDKQFHKSQRVTHFSDCMVVSYRVDEESAVFWLLNEIAFAVIGLVERGFLIRGALTAGKLHHTKKHVVGPALVDAYTLESKVANSPRILIDDKVIDIAKAAHSQEHDEEHEEEYVRAFMTEDGDGRHYFDYVSWDSVVHITGGDNDLYPSYLAKIGKLLEKGLAHNSSAVQEKYLWLHPQYVAAIELVKSLPPDAPYRLDYPGHCQDIENLPTHTTLATAAQASVAAAKAKAKK